ncbi:MAG: transposase [Phototrophicaceae bacterium]
MRQVDVAFPQDGQLIINEKGEPTLKRIYKKPTPHGAVALKSVLKERMPERNLLDVLTFVEQWINYTRHFAPLSGSDPKINNPLARYLMTVFTYGCNLGPHQAARHSRGQFTPRTLAYVNRQHIITDKLEAAVRDVINFYARFDLPRYWGLGKTVAADGTLFNTYLNNVMAERHIRYGKYGGIAYHHVSDTYIALFSHFISVGVYEAVYIIDGLLKNTSDIQPDTLHADTHGQSLTVFGLTHLLGIQLMPRIRNWKDLILYKPDKEMAFENIGTIVTGVINWDLIRKHWRDYMRVVLSIKAGRLMPSTLLRKLGNFSRRNRLFRAFRELGRVIRTIFLLRYITDDVLRRRISATTNKVESYNNFIEWIFYGGHGVIAHNDPIEQEKRIKYNDLVASALIVMNVADMTRILQQLNPDEYAINRATIATLSPYWTDHIRRFGDFIVDIDLAVDAPVLDFPLTNED